MASSCAIARKKDTAIKHINRHRFHPLNIASISSTGNQTTTSNESIMNALALHTELCARVLYDYHHRFAITIAIYIKLYCHLSALRHSLCSKTPLASSLSGLPAIF